MESNSSDEYKIYFDLPHTKHFFDALVPSNNTSTSATECPFQLEQQVKVDFVVNGVQSFRKGVVKWIGFHPRNKNQMLVGVALEMKTIKGGTDGHFPQESDRRFFECGEQRGVIVPSKYVTADFNDKQKKDKYKQGKAEFVSGSYPSFDKDSTNLKLNLGNGIQGRTNSCYLDSSLFAMFAFNDTFDDILIPKAEHSDNVKEFCRQLKEGIVAPLRKNCFVPHVNVMQMRKLFENISKTQGMTTDQKDAEEFMSTLFDKILRLEPFVDYQSGDNSHIMQLLSEVYSPVGTFHQLVSNLKDLFAKIPKHLIVILPRVKTKFIGFDAFDFELQISIKQFVTNKQQGDNYNFDLFAVLCIETSHYVTFVRDVQQQKWYLFDSMADREDNYNIPSIEEVEDLERWLKEDYHDSIYRDKTFPRNMNENQSRFVKTAYILFYRPSC